MRNINQRIDDFLQERLDDYIQETAQLSAIPSVSAVGENMEACADMVAELLAGRGFAVEKIPSPGHPIVVGRLEGESERTLLFYNHYDVQPPEPLEEWTSPPFEPVVREGALYGRGVKDDKGEFVARLAAVEAVRAAHGGVMPCGVTFVVEGQEEIGSPHIAQFVLDNKELLRCHGSIWEEGGISAQGRPINYLGVRGILYVELSVQVMARDAHSGGAHILPNAAWRLHWALDTLKGRDERVLIPGFYDDVKPPSEKDLEILAGLPDNRAHTAETLEVGRFVRGADSAEEYYRAVFEPTCNIAGLTAGYQGEGLKTVIPARASAKMDFRLVPDQNPEDIFAKLRAHLDAQGFEDVKVNPLGKMWPAKVDPGDPLVELTSRTGEAVYGQPAQLYPMVGGSSPIYAFAGPLGGIPVVRAGVGYWNNRTHAPDEHVRLEDFLNAARHMARILDGFGAL